MHSFSKYHPPNIMCFCIRVSKLPKYLKNVTCLGRKKNVEILLLDGLVCSAKLSPTTTKEEWQIIFKRIEKKYTCSQ